MLPVELAARLQVATPTVVKAATRMVKDGLIERRPDLRDRRMVRLRLTEKGCACIRSMIFCSAAASTSRSSSLSVAAA
ncbi:MarR family transcriptional regulator [Dactylosporangium sp. NPDC048998]|uniref:MarR family transcriptional regulator n=1 Tax=Dactylosporangium sp. NPDC048998 TaxID=3363976 RepID=UPI00371B4EE6